VQTKWHGDRRKDLVKEKREYRLDEARKILDKTVEQKSSNCVTPGWARGNVKDSEEEIAGGTMGGEKEKRRVW